MMAKRRPLVGPGSESHEATSRQDGQAPSIDQGQTSGDMSKSHGRFTRVYADTGGDGEWWVPRGYHMDGQIVGVFSN